MMDLYLILIVVLLAAVGCAFFFVNKGKLKAKAPSKVPEKTESVALQADVLVPEKPGLKKALENTSSHIFGRMASLFLKDHQNHFDEIEEILYTSDLGPMTVERLMETVKTQLSRAEKKDLSVVKNAFQSEFQKIFDPLDGQIPLKFNENGPTVIMVVGVNGVGKTTSIGKLAARLAQQNKKVLVAAGDTFRAAAGSQLKTWTDRAQVEIFLPSQVTDPSAIAFDAVSKAKNSDFHVVILDTAGRLHTQANLMEELRKIKRVMGKALPGAPHEVLIVLDANSGQNALNQAKEFHQSVQLTGIILTKMDGTAKGGVALALANELQVPIKMIGVGEKLEDLKPFASSEYISALIR